MDDCCKIVGCSNRIIGRGWCSKHYQRWRKYGDAFLHLPETYEERFWLSVSKGDGCWLWTGAVAGRYGQCRCALNQKIPTHRYSWMLHFGPIPEGLLVCHRCDVPLCVRPDHLFLGTEGDNMRDMVAKGRHPKQRPIVVRTKLTAEQVMAIRSSAETTKSLARRFDVSEANIYRIKTRLTWRHI